MSNLKTVLKIKIYQENFNNKLVDIQIMIFIYKLCKRCNNIIVKL